MFYDMTRFFLLASFVAQLALSAPVETEPISGIKPRLVNPAYAEDAKSLWGYSPDNTITKRLVNPAYAEDAKSLWGYNTNKDKREYGPDFSGPEVGDDSNEEFAGYHIPGAKRSNANLEDLQELPNGWIDYGRLYEAPSAVNPIYQNLSADHQLYKRADSGPLYGSSGKPSYEDVHQTTNPSCGFASVMAAVAYSNPEWIASKVKFEGNVGDVSSATVTLYDAKTFSPRDFTIAHSETARNSDIDPATGIWWPGLFNHAAVKQGMNNQNGALGPIGPWEALSVITGHPSRSHDGISADDLFKMAQKAASDRTPMVFQTLDRTTTLVANHAFSVLGASGSGGDRKIELYNPWGSKVDVPLDVAMRELYALWSLKTYDTFAGSSNNAQPAPAPAPAPSSNGTGQKTVTKQEDQPTSTQERQQQGQTTVSRRRPRPTSEGNIGISNANVKPVPKVESPKVEENVVVVTVEEVVTVYVTA